MFVGIARLISQSLSFPAFEAAKLGHRGIVGSRHSAFVLYARMVLWNACDETSFQSSVMDTSE